MTAPRIAVVRRGPWLNVATIAYNALGAVVALVAGIRAALSLIVLSLLARAKRRVAIAIGSGALAAEARQTSCCASLSAILPGGLALNTDEVRVTSARASTGEAVSRARRRDGRRR